MWNLFERLGIGRPQSGPDAKRGIDSVLRALDDGAGERPQPTLVCRQCGLKYTNTGTYLQGSRCPQCHPGG
jgi:predicted Zn-ribbon and HTH transcriptional regulator